MRRRTTTPVWGKLVGMATVGSAKITFEADASGVSADLSAQLDKALTRIEGMLNRITSNVEQGAQRAGGAVGDNISDGASRADAAVKDVGKGGFTNVEQSAAQAVSSIDGIADAAGDASGAIQQVDGDGFTRAGAAASDAAATIASTMTDAAGRASGALDSVDGDGFARASAAAADAAGTIGTDVPTAAKRAEDAMRRAGDEGDASLGRATGSASILTGALGKVAVAAAALAGPATIVQKGWARLTSIDEARHKLMALGNSASDIEQIMDNAMESVTGTSFGFGDAAAQASMLVAAGIEPGRELESTLKLVADSAAVAGVDLNEMGAIWGKVAASGKLSGEEMAQLLDRQIGLQSALADHYGVTAEEAKKMVSEGKVDFADFRDVMENMVGGGAEVMGGTVRASLENVGAAAGRLGEALLTPIFTAAPVFLTGVQKALGKTTDGVKALMGWFEDGSVAAEVLKVAIIAIGSTMVIGSIVGVVQQLGSMAQVTAAVTKALQMLNLSFLMSGPGLLIMGIVAVVAAFVTLWNRSEAFREFWIGMWDRVKSVVGDAADWISEKWEMLTGAWGDLVSAFTSDEAVEGDGALGRLIGTDRANTILGWLQTIKGAWSELTAALRGEDWGNGALAYLIGDERADWVIETISTVHAAWDELTAAFRGGDEGYGALAALIGEDAAEWAVNALASVQDAWDELKAAFSGGDDGYGALSAIFGEQGAEWLVNAVAMVGDGLRALWDALQSLWTVVQELGASLGGAIWETARSVFASLVEVGQALFGAFWEIAQAVWGLIQALAPVLLPILKVIAIVIGATLFAAINIVIGAFRVIAEVVKIAANILAWLSSNVLAPLIGVIANVASILIGALVGALSAVVDWTGKVIAFVVDMGGKIVGVFSGAGTWLWDAGVSIVQGLMNGIKSLAGTIGSFFLDLLPGWIRGPFEKALGIASPSKVFADYGQSIGEGIIVGVQSTQGAVADATHELAGAAVAGAQSVRAPGGFPAVGDADVSSAGVGLSGEQMGQFADEALAATQGVVVPAWQNMAGTLAATQSTVIAPTMQAMQNSTAAMAARFPAEVANTITPAMNRLGATMWNVKTTGIDPVFSGIQSGLTATANAFGTGVNAMNAHMNRLRAGAADPVRFTMNTVFSDGLVEMWNSVSAMIGTKTMPKRYAAFASGGVMKGAPYSPGRDNMRFFDPVHGNVLDLSGHEAVMRPEFTRALGEDRINEINAVARRGGVAGVGRYMEHFGFARGGVFPGGQYLGGFRPGGVIYGGGVRMTPITSSHAAWVGRHFPDLFTLTSALRFTDSGHHSRGQATDWQARDGQFATQNPTRASKALARALYATFPTAAELIHWPLDGWQNHQHGRAMNFGAATNNQHRNHVHFATLGPIGAGAAGLDSVGINWDVDWGRMLAEWLAPDLDKVRNAVASRSFPGAFGGVPQGTYESLKKPMLDTMTTAMKESMMFSGGGDVNRWRPLAMQALKRHGYNPADHIEAMLKQIQIESNGDPGAINRWDSNWLAGHPSGGLLQVIEPTYRRVRSAYPEAFRGLPDDHMFPATNLTAGVGAVRMDWGGPAGRWPTTLGYERGGVMGAGRGVFHKTAFEPERVLSPRQTASFEGLVNWLDSVPAAQIGTSGGTRGSYAGERVVKQVHVTQNIVAADPRATANEVENRLLKLTN